MRWMGKIEIEKRAPASCVQVAVSAEGSAGVVWALYEITFGYNKTCRISIQDNRNSRFVGPEGLDKHQELHLPILPVPGSST